MAKKSPAGAVVCGIISFLLAAYYCGLFILLNDPALNSERISNPFFGVTFLPLLLYVPSGIGVITLARWARKLMVDVSIYNLIFCFLAVPLAGFVPKPGCSTFSEIFVLAGIILFALPLIFPLIFLWYFTRPKVKELFE